MGVFRDFEDFRCTSWAKGQHFGGHVRDVSFRHPVKVYFGKVPLQNSILYNFVIVKLICFCQAPKLVTVKRFKDIVYTGIGIYPPPHVLPK